MAKHTIIPSILEVVSKDEALPLIFSSNFVIAWSVIGATYKPNPDPDTMRDINLINSVELLFHKDIDNIPLPDKSNPIIVHK